MIALSITFRRRLRSRTTGVMATLRTTWSESAMNAALSEAKEMRDGQVVLLADNLRRTGNDPTLFEYIRFRDPELLGSILAGHMPELPSPEHPLTLICPGPPNGR